MPLEVLLARVVGGKDPYPPLDEGRADVVLGGERVAPRRPPREPSERRSSKMAFRTGACRATQPILRCPSGARAGSLTMDSSIMALLFQSVRRAELRFNMPSLQAKTTDCCRYPRRSS